MLTGWWKVADHTLGSVLELVRPIPALALIPLAIVWLGFGEESKVTVIAYAAFSSVYINTQAGVRNVDPLFVKVMRVYGNGTRDTGEHNRQPLVAAHRIDGDPRAGGHGWQPLYFEFSPRPRRSRGRYSDRRRRTARAGA